MAYIWTGSKAPNYLMACTDSDTPSEIYNCLLQGVKIDRENLTFRILTPSEKQLLTLKEKLYSWDILDTTRYVPLVNKKVLDILERECSGKFQAIPAILKLPNKEEIKDYFAINVINKIPIASLEDCIKKDEYKDDNNVRGFIFSCKAYYSAIIEQEDICKDNIIEPASLIFISERLRNIFKKEKIKGAEFYKNLRDSVILV